MNRRSILKFFSALVAAPSVVASMPIEAEAKIKQVVYGRFFNVPVMADDRCNLIFKVSDHRLASIDAIRDGGLELVMDGDSPTRRALLSATIFPGHARTCLKEGLVRLGAQAWSLLTVDAEGEDLHSSVIHEDQLCGNAHGTDWVNKIDKMGLLIRS